MKKIIVYLLVMGAMLVVSNIHAADVEPLRPANWEKLDLDNKIQWLISQMSLEEKVEQLNIQPDKSKSFAGLGDRSQLWNKRLGIGPILATNGPRGPRPSGDLPKNRINNTNGKGPVSPTGLALASTWNTELQQEVGRQWGLLVKEYGLNTIWAPGVNIIKDPRAGRNTDYASEDPYFTGAFGMAITKGVQSVGVAATIKHLAANNWESGRQSHNVEVPMRPLREIYLPCFQIPVQEGDAWAIMTCYNALNGEWGSANKWLITDLVRNEWGFKGFIVSDWGAQLGSVAQAIKAGQNIELPGQRFFNFAAVEAALKRNEITIADVDARVAELLRVKLDKLSYFGEETPSGYNLDTFSRVIRRAGGESVVLLKNNKSMLPLHKSQSVALIGPFANNADFIIGNAGSSAIRPSYVVTVKDALEANGITVNYEQGGDDGFFFSGAKFQQSFPCKIKYYNGLDLKEPFVYSTTTENLILNNIKAGGFVSQTIPDGFKGKALRLSGSQSISPMSTPGGAWTLRFQMRIQDQLPAADRSVIRFFANKQVMEISSSEYKVDVDGFKKNQPLNWNDMDKRWVELVISYDGKQVSVYREGKILCKASGVGQLNSQNIIFGYNNQGLPMEVDELQTWNAALTPDQLTNQTPIKTEAFENFKIDTEAIDGIPGIKNNLDMSLRAISLFTPDRPGKVGFEIETRGGIRVFIDGTLVYDLNDEQKAGGTKNQFWHIFTDTKPHPIVVEYRSKQKNIGDGFLRLLYTQPPANDIFANAVAAAKASDVAIVCVGVPSKQQAENIDRPRFELPSWQDELILAVRKANPKTVVILFTEGGADVQSWIDAVPAAIVAFHPGSEGGNIITDVLYGDVNPSGKLTVTWPKANEDLPTTGPDTHYKNTINEFGYRYFDAKGIKPMFAFGYGLSYTTFKYRSLKVEKSSSDRYPVLAKVTVKNTGKVAGKEVIQVYATDDESSVEQAKKELAGFIKIYLNPGETKTFEIPLHWTGFQLFDVKKNKWVLESGVFTIHTGGSSDALKLKKKITL